MVLEARRGWRSEQGYSGEDAVSVGGNQQIYSHVVVLAFSNHPFLSFLRDPFVCVNIVSPASS